METVWFALIALMLAVYVVLDGFDFGAGILHLAVAKTDAERRTVLAAIGPVWDGNEVWLIASGGVLVFAFPRVYAAGFSGFYMPLMIVLWLLVLRGISIEFRSQQQNPLWRSFWDGMFFFSSTLMAIVLGAALGNVIRGVPLDASGYFTGPLFTNFVPGPQPGVLDWYTVLVGLFALSVLAGHGALYLTWKTSGPVQARSQAIAPRLWVVVVILGVLTTLATSRVQPALYANLLARPWGWLLALLVAASLVVLFLRIRQRNELHAFLASAVFIASLLGATAAGLYPNLLVSTLDSAYNITAFNGAAGTTGLRVGLIWWVLAILLAIGYFIFLFRSFQGKVTAESDGHGY
ncbi:MAG TPA: cytochrome d ubiquinol oxidase subunit II [Chthonomonadaceae bacterium]|nr:cytochrome d ubiquinol oxidase subunit II [Chthonomonadaceae bacterium]